VWEVWCCVNPGAQTQGVQRSQKVKGSKGSGKGFRVSVSRGLKKGKVSFKVGVKVPVVPVKKE